MSEPITLYHTSTGEQLTVSAPRFADHLVASGEYSREPVVTDGTPNVEAKSEVHDDVTQAEGIDADLAQILALNHLHSKAAINLASDDDILAVQGIGPKKLKALREWAEGTPE